MINTIFSRRPSRPYARRCVSSPALRSCGRSAVISRRPRRRTASAHGVLYIGVGLTLLGLASSPHAAARFVARCFFDNGNAFRTGQRRRYSQLVPQRFKQEIGVVTGIVGAAGGIGGFLLPNLLGQVKQWTSSFGGGFLVFLRADRVLGRRDARFRRPRLATRVPRQRRPRRPPRRHPNRTERNPRIRPAASPANRLEPLTQRSISLLFRVPLAPPV